MPNLTTKMVRLLERAADLRAAGNSWEQIAKKVHRNIDAVRAWPHEFAEVWDRRFTESSRRLGAEAEAEARAVLRVLLRDDDSKVKREAAKHLFDHARRNAVVGDLPSHTSEFHRLADYLEGLSDEDRQSFLDAEPILESDPTGDGPMGSEYPKGLE